MDNKLSIIQWNCQGLQAKYEALKILIHENSPICISLQETMMCPRDYVLYHIDYDEERGSHGGSGLLIRQDISHASIPLQTDLQAVAVQIYLKRKYTVCSVYIPPGNNLIHDLRNDLDQGWPDFWILRSTLKNETLLRSTILHNHIMLLRQLGKKISNSIVI